LAPGGIASLSGTSTFQWALSNITYTFIAIQILSKFTGKTTILADWSENLANFDDASFISSGVISRIALRCRTSRSSQRSLLLIAVSIPKGRLSQALPLQAQIEEFSNLNLGYVLRICPFLGTLLSKR